MIVKKSGEDDSDESDHDGKPADGKKSIKKNKK